jgi:hypothetical protein
MKRLVLIVALSIIPFTAHAHPGKTDHHGGHKCIKGCEDWGLYYAEYHLHDKYGKPIRIGSKMNAARPADQSTATETIVTPQVTSATQTITVYRTVTTVQEGDVIASNPLLWVLVVLLLLLLIFLKNRKKEEA